MDDAFRSANRTATATGSPDDRRALIVARLRAGTLSQERFAAAAYAGDEGAAAVSGLCTCGCRMEAWTETAAGPLDPTYHVATRDLLTWSAGVDVLGSNGAKLAAALGAADAAFATWSRSQPCLGTGHASFQSTAPCSCCAQPWTLMSAARTYLAEPTEANARVVWAVVATTPPVGHDEIRARGEGEWWWRGLQWLVGSFHGWAVNQEPCLWQILESASRDTKGGEAAARAWAAASLRAWALDETRPTMLAESANADARTNA